jgi:hypothetical protein
MAAAVQHDPVGPEGRADVVRPQIRLAASTSAPEPLLPPAHRTLADIEDKLRAAETLTLLQVRLAHDVRALGAIERIIVAVPHARRGWSVISATGAAQVDPDSPASQWMASLLTDKLPVQPGAAGVIGPFEVEQDTGKTPYQAVILDLSRGSTKPRRLGAVLLLATAPWRPAQLQLLSQLAGTAAHAWSALEPVSRKALSRATRSVGFGACAAILAALVVVPVPMTALAPTRVVAVEPTVIAAPIDGVIDDILVKPNDAVREGMPLLRYNDLALAAKADTADRELKVADAKAKRLAMAAFTSADAKREMAIAEAERELKRVERDFALDQLQRSRMVAPRAGVALYGDRRDWVGRPVATGERIMEIGDPARVEMQLDLPVEDAIAMAIGQKVSVFLDTAPLSPVAATVSRINHEPRPLEGKGLAFSIHATITDGQTAPLGVRGTAHIRGESVPLGLFLFRRPISYLRQWLGL